MGNKMSLEVEAQVLTIIKKNPVGVRELSMQMKRRTQTMVDVIKKMNATGLVEVKPDKTDTRGRPKLLVRSTTLGDDFLETYTRLSRLL